jgi:hypothetical protein
MAFSRIRHDSAAMDGKSCLRGLRISVGTIVGLVASGVSRDRILAAYPLLEPLISMPWRPEPSAPNRDRLSVYPLRGLLWPVSPSCF